MTTYTLPNNGRWQNLETLDTHASFQLQLWSAHHIYFAPSISFQQTALWDRHTTLNAELEQVLPPITIKTITNIHNHYPCSKTVWVSTLKWRSIFTLWTLERILLLESWSSSSSCAKLEKVKLGTSREFLQQKGWDLHLSKHWWILLSFLLENWEPDDQLLRFPCYISKVSIAAGEQIGN